jgi:hypothetical protein
VRDRRWWFVLALLPLLAVAGAVVSSVRDDGSTSGPSPPPGPPPADRGPAPVVVSSTGEARYPDLPSLVAASDTVVIARVIATGRGRVVADDPSGGAGIVTRLVRLEVDEVLAGVDPGAEVVVEEPGWLLDGAPVLVDGVAGSTVGDLGVWFLVRGGDEAFPYWAVVNAQGRYLVDPVDETRLVDVPVADRLIDDLEAEDPVILRHRVEEAASVVPTAGPQPPG